MWWLREDTSWPQKQRSASHAARSSSGVRTGTVFVLPLRTPLLNLLNSFAGVTADMYADDLSIIVKGQSREDAIPTANMVLQKLHAWSQENGLAINPSKCEAAWFTLSTHTESDYDREGRWPLVAAGCQIPSHDHGGIANYEASRHGSRSTTDAKCGGHQAMRCHFATDIAATLYSAQRAGPSPHDLRTFVIGYGASKLTLWQRAHMGSSDGFSEE
ncbi:hypothetical protein C4B63_72g30 [Trypanosoma cruzi]|uniref:Uncharacterized protein n=1 Tax=Trypanosoma cruzi TaxID=5693 RepID=A0A2V2UWS2_TRYCR|nr:hypothetical protein C4B63_72g30 [Trypanosoma cruzi]